MAPTLIPCRLASTRIILESLQKQQAAFQKLAFIISLFRKALEKDCFTWVFFLCLLYGVDTLESREDNSASVILKGSSSERCCQ